MFVIIGYVLMFVCIIVGYTMHHGHIATLIQINELIIIGGAAISSMIVAGGKNAIPNCIKNVMAVIKGNPFTKAAYLDLLQMLYDLFMIARKDGLLALEQHAEYPEASDLFARFPFFSHNHHAVSFLTDNLKLILLGGVGVYDLSDLMDLDLEVRREELRKTPALVAKTGDAMPGFGIVAAVLGVVITMQYISGKPEEIGEKVAAALVGTFLGVLMAYGVFGPMAHAMEELVEAEMAYFKCIKDALLSFAKGDSAMVSVEFARRNIDPEVRPSFAETETRLRQKKADDSAQQAAA